MIEFFQQISNCLTLSSVEEKCRAVSALGQAVETGDYEFDPHVPVIALEQVGWPSSPELVKPGRLSRRRLGSEKGRAALVHSVAHIEFNAINIALDAACRFRNMPGQYYLDWISVAVDEARHFTMMSDRLHVMGYCYGDFPAHNGLWEMAERTADDCMKRMALVPRVLEARGLDVTPGMIDRLLAVGDDETVRLLRIILEEEVRHVEIGSHWFHLCCDQRGLPREETFINLISEYFKRGLRGPFNIPARMQAGFTQREMDALINGGS